MKFRSAPLGTPCCYMLWAHFNTMHRLLNHCLRQTTKRSARFLSTRYHVLLASWWQRTEAGPFWVPHQRIKYRRILWYLAFTSTSTCTLFLALNCVDTESNVWRGGREDDSEAVAPKYFSRHEPDMKKVSSISARLLVICRTCIHGTVQIHTFCLTKLQNLVERLHSMMLWIYIPISIGRCLF